MATARSIHPDPQKHLAAITRRRRWSYVQITDRSKARIAEFMDKANRETDPFSRGMFRDWAWGVYWLWSNLTSGWQVDGDDAQMKSLLEFKTCPR